MVKINHKIQDMATMDNWVDKVLDQLMSKKNIKFGLRLLKFSFLIPRPRMKGPNLMLKTMGVSNNDNDNSNDAANGSQWWEHGTCIKPTDKLVSSPSGALLMLRQTTSNLDSQDSPRPGLGGNHHLPPHSIFCVSPRHLHPNDFLSQDSQGGVPKLFQFGLLKLCKFITLCSDLQLG